MNMDEDSMEQISLKKKQILGSYSWQGNMDMFNIVMIGLAKEPAKNDKKHMTLLLASKNTQPHAQACTHTHAHRYTHRHTSRHIRK